MKVKEESEKVGLKLNIQKTKIMASGPITSWQIDGERGSKITADGDCSHEIKRRLLLGRKLLTDLDSIFKSRDITLPTKVHLVKAMVFPVVMYGCESLTIKKAEHWRIDAFELWCWRRLLGVPWTARRSNQTIPKEISPEYSLEELMLKLQYFGHLMWRTDSFEKTQMLGKIEGGKRRGRQRMRWLDGIIDSMDMSLTQWTWIWVNSGSWWWTGRPGVLRFMGSQSQTQLSDWTELKWATSTPKICRIPWHFDCREQFFSLNVYCGIICILLHDLERYKVFSHSFKNISLVLSLELFLPPGRSHLVEKMTCTVDPWARQVKGTELLNSQKFTYKYTVSLPYLQIHPHEFNQLQVI